MENVVVSSIKALHSTDTDLECLLVQEFWRVTITSTRTIFKVKSSYIEESYNNSPPFIWIAILILTVTLNL